MKKLLIALGCTMLISFPAIAGSAPDIHILEGDNGLTTLTAEVFWSQGKYSGLSFIDVYDEGSLTYFHNNTINRQIGDSVFYAGVEFGSRGVRGGDHFLGQGKVGVGIALTKLSFMDNIFSKVFVVAGTTVYKAAGEDVDQLKVNWKTKSWKLSDRNNLYSSGFFRIRDGAPNIYQPQLWLTYGDAPWETGYELSLFGDREIHQLTIRFKW